MREWDGITVDEHGNVTAVDLRVLDPSLERHHRLPHLQLLDLSGLPVTKTYLQQTALDYAYHQNLTAKLTGCDGVDFQMLELVAGLSGLIALDLSGCKDVTDSDLAKLIVGLSLIHI